jgi:hypothetical protein
LSCGGDRLTSTERHITPPGTNDVLWDGSQPTGNQNVFFLPPLVKDPSTIPGTSYGANPFQPGLPVEIEIACLTPAPPTSTTTYSCDNRGLPRTAAKLSTSDQQYMLNWDTKAPGFDGGFVFQIRVWIGSKEIAYADVLLVPNGNPKNQRTNDDITLADGRTMPIKVRVQQGWNCRNQSACATQGVTNTPPAGQQYTVVTTNDGRDALAFPANWFDPNAVQGGQVLVTIEDVSSDPDVVKAGGCREGVTVMTTVNHCVRVTTDPANVILQQNVLVATCVDHVLSLPGGYRQLIMKYDVGEEPIFLRVDPTQQLPITCLETASTSKSSNKFVRFASNALSRVGGAFNWLLGVKEAYAIDLGVGGSLDAGSPCCSLFTLGFPVAMTAASGDGQTGNVGDLLPAPVSVRLRALHRNSFDNSSQVTDASVTCVPSGGSGSVIVSGAPTASGTASYDAESDTYICPRWELGAIGTNTLIVRAASVDPTVQIEILNTDDESTSCGDIESVTSFPSTCRRYRGAITFTARGVAGPLLSPANLSVFSIFPRTTTLAWSAVSGATSYQVERAYCESWTMPDYPSTCSVWTTYPIETVDATSLVFDFVGAQPGRWRVRPVFSSGSNVTVGDWSSYWYFRYTI